MTQRAWALPSRLSLLALIAIGLWLLLGLTNLHELVTGVRVGLPRSDNIYAQHLLFDGPVQLLPILSVIILHACASIIGYAAVVRPVWGRCPRASNIWLLLAGLIPGSLILITAARVASLCLGNGAAPGFLFAAMLAGSVLAVQHVHAHKRNDGGVWNWGSVWPAGIAILVAMIFTIQMDRFHIVGEASSWFINDIYLSTSWGIGAGAKFPLVSQHYDEAALLYPVIYGLMHKGAGARETLPYLYWIMVALGRVSVGSLIYLSLRSFRVDRLSALICLGFVGLASLSVNPISSRLLFDSLSPLAYGLHIARILIPVLPLLLTSAFAELHGRSMRGASLIVAALLGAGLSAMPVHVLLVLVWAIPLLCVAEMAPVLGDATGVWRAASNSAAGILVAFMIAYGMASRLPASACVTILLFGATAGSANVIVAWCRAGIPLNWKGATSGPCRALLAIVVGYGIGLLFLGNILVPVMDKFLSHLWPWAGVEVADRAVSHLGTASAALVRSPYCGGYYWEFRNLAGHCSSLPILVRTYGLAFAALAGALAWWIGKSRERMDAGDNQRTLLLCGIFLCLVAMPICFVAFDFVGPTDGTFEWQRQLSIWLRSRLIEPWFCGGLLLSLAFFFRTAELRGRRVVQSTMLFAIAVGGLVPVVFPAQMIVNLTFLIQGLSRPF